MVLNLTVVSKWVWNVDQFYRLFLFLSYVRRKKFSAKWKLRSVTSAAISQYLIIYHMN